MQKKTAIQEKQHSILKIPDYTFSHHIEEKYFMTLKANPIKMTSKACVVSSKLSQNKAKNT